MKLFLKLDRAKSVSDLIRADVEADHGGPLVMAIMTESSKARLIHGELGSPSSEQFVALDHENALSATLLPGHMLPQQANGPVSPPRQLGAGRRSSRAKSRSRHT